MIIVEIDNYMMYIGLVMVKFNSGNTKGPEIIDL